MTFIQRFLLACSGATPSFLKRAPSDTNKFLGIGGTILFTGLLASIAAGFALYTIFESYWVAIGFGLIWGLMIFNLDRFIVSTMKNKGSWTKNLGQVLPRLGMAVLIAVVISKPLELKLFQSEIQGELVLMEQELYKDQEVVAKSRFDADIDNIKEEMQANDALIATSLSNVNVLDQEAIAEADGTGGSQKRNMGPIYKIKKAKADQARTEHQLYASKLEAHNQQLAGQLSRLEDEKQLALKTMEQTGLNGFAAQLDALGRLGKKSNTIYYASLFIMLLFIAIETTPIFAKLIAGNGPYDYTQAGHEYLFQQKYERQYAIQKAHIDGEINLVQKTTKTQSDQLASARNELFLYHLQEKVEEEKQKQQSWASLFGKRKWMEI